MEIPRFDSGDTLQVRVFTRTVGRGRPTLLCVHGFGDNLHSWNALTATSVARGRQVVALDLPGFGDSPLTPEFAAHYSMHAVELIHRLVARELAGGPVFLVGNSLGGAIGLGAAVLDARSGANRFAGLLLAAPASPRTRTPIFVRLLRSPAYRWADGLSRRLAGGPRRAAASLVARVGFRTMLAPGIRPAADWSASVTRAFERPGAFLDLERVARDAMWVLRGEAPGISDLMDGTSAVSIPVTVLRGELDRVISRRELQEMVATLPRARYVELPRIGHCPQNEAPEETARLLQALLDEAKGATRSSPEPGTA